MSSGREFAYSIEDDGSQVESEDGDELEGWELIELMPDVYGATTYSVIHDGYDLITGKDHDELTASVNGMRVVFCTTSLAVNYIMQFGLLYFSYFFVASPAVARVQNIYKEYHRDCFLADGSYSDAKWHAWPIDKKHQLCNIVYSNFFFLYCILVLWWMTILNEFRTTERKARYFAKVRSVDDDMIEMNEEDDTEKVVGFVPQVRCVLYMCIIAPKLIISVILLVVGSMWLTATEDFADLVLNAVALEFIIQVDETIFDAMFPNTVKNQIGNMRLMVMKAVQNPTSLNKEVWDGFMRSWVYYLAIFALVALYLQFGQRLPYIGVLPGYADDAACPNFWAQRASRPCGILDPLDGRECFPYGPEV